MKTKTMFAQDSPRLCVIEENSSFAKRFWRGFAMAVLAGLSIVTCLVLIGYVTMKSIEGNW